MGVRVDGGSVVVAVLFCAVVLFNVVSGQVGSLVGWVNVRPLAKVYFMPLGGGFEVEGGERVKVAVWRLKLRDVGIFCFWVFYRGGLKKLEPRCCPGPEGPWL